MKLLIKNIKGLGGVYDALPSVRKGAQMAEFPLVNDAWLAIEDGRISDYGAMSEWPGISDWRDLEVMDASGRYILPGYIDSHTHLVHAGSREGEFVDRIKGLSYADIAARGGGIINSANKLASASDDELFESALHRAHKAMKAGSLGFEIKSGYGLTPDAELKMLRVINRLKDALPVPVKITFLGAHAVPPAFIGRTDAYVDQVITEMLPRIADEAPADYLDVFCEKGYFSVDQTLKLIAAGARYGLKAKVHVNQFTAGGGVRACVEAGALTLDHLEVLTDDDLDALSGGSTLPVALPGCSFFLKIPYTLGRTIIDAGLPLVLASDYNPGSAPSWNMNTVLSLACVHMGLLPAEAFNAVTVNGAAAIELNDRAGAISPGMPANIIITEELSSLDFLPYSFGESCIWKVLVNGRDLEV